MKLSMKKKIAVAAAAASIVGGASAALAYWTTSGTGSGSATTGTSTAVNVAQVGAITDLYPGSPAQAVDFSIDNTTANNQFITTVAVSIASVVPGGPPGSCTADDFTLTQPTATYGDLTPGVHTYSPSGSELSLNNAATNQDGCKNATVNLAFAAS